MRGEANFMGDPKHLRFKACKIPLINLYGNCFVQKMIRRFNHT